MRYFPEWWRIKRTIPLLIAVIIIIILGELWTSDAVQDWLSRFLQ